ncbi:MAG: VWA-like domain-containing protein [Eubacteriales bacterium]|nr:VWA-like domain-containing protein [Eubacteriales bacterium]
MSDWKKIFLETKQAPLKLKIALEHYFTEEAGEWKERCGVYLKQRIRPAVDVLIAENDAGKIEQLLQSGWITDGVMDEAVRKAAAVPQTEILSLLLRYKRGQEYDLKNICLSQDEICGFYRKRSKKTKKDICNKIWNLSVLSLNQKYPFFRTFLCGLRFVSCEDGGEKNVFLADVRNSLTVCYREDFLIEQFCLREGKTERILLHMMMHCMFLHITMTPRENNRLWNVACDMAAERIIRRIERDSLSEKETICPEEIYQVLMSGNLSEEEERKLEKQYQADDHCFWDKTGKKHILECVQKQWEQIPKEKGYGPGGNSGGHGSKEGADSEKIHIQKREQIRFRQFLRQFALTGEEMQTDMESIDYIPYLYGLVHYGNMPLVEHLEYCEVRKLQELVIAIDTSGSCRTDTVRRFMEEVYGILSDRENFFRKMNVYILQCDFMVQNAAHITCEEEWKEYLEHLTIYGRGDTDFQPVFQYVETLRKEKKLKNLKGLLYFTDGDGIYPRDKTSYKTAFIFYDKKVQQQKVPSWAWQFELEDL